MQPFFCLRVVKSPSNGDGALASGRMCWWLAWTCSSVCYTVSTKWQFRESRFDSIGWKKKVKVWESCIYDRGSHSSTSHVYRLFFCLFTLFYIYVLWHLIGLWLKVEDDFTDGLLLGFWWCGAAGGGVDMSSVWQMSTTNHKDKLWWTTALCGTPALSFRGAEDRLMPNVALRYRGRGGGASLGEDVWSPWPSAGCWRRPGSQLGRRVYFFVWFKRGFHCLSFWNNECRGGRKCGEGHFLLLQRRERGDAPVTRCAAVAF